jgi:hypothetical protein
MKLIHSILPLYRTIGASALQRYAALLLLVSAFSGVRLDAQVISTSGTVSINNTSGTVIVTNTMENNTGATLTNSGTLNSTDVTNGGTLNGNGTYNVSSAFTNSGTFTPGTSTVEFTGTGSQTVPSVNFNNLIISGAGTTTLSANASVTGDLTLTGGTFDLSSFTANRFSAGGTFTIAASCTLRIGGNGTTLPSNFTTNTFDPAAVIEYYGTNQSVPGGTYDNLNVAGSGTTITLGANVDVVGDLIITNGTLDLSTFTANRTTSGGTLSVGAGGSLKIGGTNTIPTNYTTYSFDPASTVEYSGTSQPIGAFNYGNLTVSASGTLTLANTGTIGIAGAFTPGIGTYVTTGSTIDYNLNGAQTVAAFSYNNLTLSTGGTKTFASGTTSIVNTFTLTGAAADATTNSSTIEYAGTGAQTVAAMTYYNLRFANGGTKTMFGAITVNNNVVTDSGSIIVIDASGTMVIHGDLDNSGDFTNHGILNIIP